MDTVGPKDAGPPPAARFALVVVNYGSSRLLATNLADMKPGELGGQIVVVDNFTSMEERECVRELAESQGWASVLLDTNRGFGGGMNAGASAALLNGAEVIVALNPDARIEPDDLMRLVSAVAGDPELAVAPTIRSGTGSVWFDGIDLYLDSGRVASRRRRMPPPGPKEPWISGACFAISSLMWIRTGGFDEEYFLYWEDVDLSHRILQNGGRFAVLADAVAIHDAGGTQSPARGASTKSEAYYFYNIRNRLVYAAKHLDDEKLKKWLRQTPAVSYEILLAGGRRQFLHSAAPIRAYIKGIREGRRMVRDIRKRAETVRA